jgi:thioredoxin reductase (NADPH)
MARAALVVMYDDQQRLAELEQALQRRFDADYQILPAATPAAALDTLGRLRQDGEQVALVLADQWLAGMTGVEFLCQAHELHPTAKRVLFITYGNAVAGTAGLQAMALLPGVFAAGDIRHGSSSASPQPSAKAPPPSNSSTPT